MSVFGLARPHPDKRKTVDDVRRAEKKITDNASIEAILKSTTVCRVAFSDKNIPYIVPLHHGYKDNRLYFHSSDQGRKMQMLQQNNRVCFEVDSGGEVIASDKACNWTSRYRSVIGYGTAVIVEDPDEKREALDLIMSHHSKDSFEYDDKAVAGVTIFRIDIESMTGKQSGY